MLSVEEVVKRFIRLNYPAVWIMKDMKKICKDGTVVYACDPKELRCPDEFKLILEPNSTSNLFLICGNIRVKIINYNMLIESKLVEK